MLTCENSISRDRKREDAFPSSRKMCYKYTLVRQVNITLPSVLWPFDFLTWKITFFQVSY